MFDLHYFENTSNSRSKLSRWVIKQIYYKFTVIFGVKICKGAGLGLMLLYYIDQGEFVSNRTRRVVIICAGPANALTLFHFGMKSYFAGGQDNGATDKTLERVSVRH